MHSSIHILIPTHCTPLPTLSFLSSPSTPPSSHSFTNPYTISPCKNPMSEAHPSTSPTYLSSSLYPNISTSSPPLSTHLFPTGLSSQKYNAKD